MGNSHQDCHHNFFGQFKDENGGIKKCHSEKERKDGRMHRGI